MRPVSETPSIHTSGGAFLHPCGGWGHQTRMGDVQSFYCGSCGWELWSQGHRYLKGRQPSNTVVDTGGQGSRPTEQGGLPGCVIPGDSWGSCKVPTGPKDSSISRDRGETAGVGVWRGHGEGLSVSTKAFLETVRHLRRGKRGTIQLYIVRMGHCWPQLRRWLDGGKNTLRNSWTWLTHPLLYRQSWRMMGDHH